MKFISKPTDSEGNVLSTEKYVDDSLIDRFYTKSEIDSKIGDVETVLSNVSGGTTIHYNYVPE